MNYLFSVQQDSHLEAPAAGVVLIPLAQQMSWCFIGAAA